MALRGERIVTKIKVMLPDPMTDRRAAAKAEVNREFAALADREAPLEKVYLRKRQLAQAILDGGSLPADHPFAQEALLRGLSPEQFARDIVSKPDAALNADRRELMRQSILIKVDAARTPGEIAEILHDAFPKSTPDYW